MHKMQLKKANYVFPSMFLLILHLTSVIETLWQMQTDRQQGCWNLHMRIFQWRLNVSWQWIAVLTAQS